MGTLDFGGRIKTLRLSKSMTQEQLAQRLRVSPQAVSKWENGVTLPDIQLLPELSILLGTSIDALFSMTDDKRMERIENMLWDQRFLSREEFETEERFLKDNRAGRTGPRHAAAGGAVLQARPGIPGAGLAAGPQGHRSAARL